MYAISIGSASLVMDNLYNESDLHLPTNSVSENKCWAVGGLGIGRTLVSAMWLADTRYNLVFEIVVG